LTQANGAFYLTLPARRELTLVVRAIGLRPSRIPLTTGVDTAVTVRMMAVEYKLNPVTVTELNQCARSETGTADVMDTWIEVTKALESTRIARDSEKRRFHYRLYELLSDLSSGRDRVLRNDSASWVAHRPFKVTPPRELASRGYVVSDPRGVARNSPTANLLYRAPDEMVLLDESFQTSHCFWASNGSGVNQDLVGLHFLPITGSRTTDIRGVFWIDANNYELKRLDYLYTQIETAQRDPGSRDSAVAPSIRNPIPGGVIEFDRLPDGSFIIPRWRIFVNDTWTARSVPGSPLTSPRQGKETGGIVLKVESTGG
jgi:hypothetical protein